MKTICSSYKKENYFAIVDDCDYEELIKYRWYCKSRGRYPYTVIDDRQITMHRLVYKLQYDHFPMMSIDHIDRNTLNNQRCNLRVATQYQNSLNRTLSLNNTTGYAGVRLDKRTGRYQAFSEKAGLWYSIGYFNSLREAALAKDIWMTENHSEALDFLAPNILDATVEEIEYVKNMMQKAKTRNGSSQFRGVRLTKTGWTAQAQINKKWYYLGTFYNELDAAKAYDNFVSEKLGNKARTNF